MTKATRANGFVYHVLVTYGQGPNDYVEKVLRSETEITQVPQPNGPKAKGGTGLSTKDT